MGKTKEILIEEQEELEELGRVEHELVSSVSWLRDMARKYNNPHYQTAAAKISAAVKLITELEESDFVNPL